MRGAFAFGRLIVVRRGMEGDLGTGRQLQRLQVPLQRHHPPLTLHQLGQRRFARHRRDGGRALIQEKLLFPPLGYVTPQILQGDVANGQAVFGNDLQGNAGLGRDMQFGRRFFDRDRRRLVRDRLDFPALRMLCRDPLGVDQAQRVRAGLLDPPRRFRVGWHGHLPAVRRDLAADRLSVLQGYRGRSRGVGSAGHQPNRAADQPHDRPRRSGRGPAGVGGGLNGHRHRLDAGRFDHHQRLPGHVLMIPSASAVLKRTTHVFADRDHHLPHRLHRLGHRPPT